MPDEEKFLKAIAEKRKAAIDRADRKHVSQFMEEPKVKVIKEPQVVREQSDKPVGLIIFLCILLLVSLLAAVFLTVKLASPQAVTITKVVREQPTIIKEQPIVNEYHTTNEYNNINNDTYVNLETEHEMVCIGDPNSTEMKCYKKVKK
jgi:hypothetical protein